MIENSDRRVHKKADAHARVLFIQTIVGKACTSLSKSWLQERVRSGPFLIILNRDVFGDLLVGCRCTTIGFGSKQSTSPFGCRTIVVEMNGKHRILESGVECVCLIQPITTPLRVLLWGYAVLGVMH